MTVRIDPAKAASIQARFGGSGRRAG